jgi:uncharacterized protein
MFGKLDLDEIEQVIQQQLVGRIGCHVDGTTYVVPISYAYDGTFVYCHTNEGMKIEMMRKNPAICFEVDNTTNLANWQSVICWGTFEELHGGRERSDAVEKLEKRILPILSSETMQLAPRWPFPSPDANAVKGIIFRIRLTQKTGRFEKSSGEYFFAT